MFNEKIIALRQEQLLLQLKLDDLKQKLFFKTLLLATGTAAAIAGLFFFRQERFNAKICLLSFVLPGVLLCVFGLIKRTATLREARKIKSRIDEIETFVTGEEQNEKAFGLPRRYRHRFR